MKWFSTGAKFDIFFVNMKDLFFLIYFFIFFYSAKITTIKNIEKKSEYKLSFCFNEKSQVFSVNKRFPTCDKFHSFLQLSTCKVFLNAWLITIINS